MKSPIKMINEFVHEVKISDEPSEKPGEIVIEIAWVSAMYYGLGFMLLMQAQLILDGVRERLDYAITSSQFWTEGVLLSFWWLIIGVIGGFIVGLIHGSLISIIYHHNVKVSSDSDSFKFTVYFVNLLIPSLIIFLLLLYIIEYPLGDSLENFGLIAMALGAASFYTSRRFWKWWIRDNTRA